MVGGGGASSSRRRCRLSYQERFGERFFDGEKNLDCFSLSCTVGHKKNIFLAVSNDGIPL